MPDPREPVIDGFDLDGPMLALPWVRVEAGLYRAGPWVIANHPRVFPRSWRIDRQSARVHAPGFKTLRAAQQAAEQMAFKLAQ